MKIIKAVAIFLLNIPIRKYSSNIKVINETIPYRPAENDLVQLIV